MTNYTKNSKDLKRTEKKESKKKKAIAKKVYRRTY
jgi:hypothetical protein